MITHHLCSASAKETQPEPNYEETSEKLKMRKVPKNRGVGWSTGERESKSFKNVNVRKAKKRLWKYSRLKDTKKT